MYCEKKCHYWVILVLPEFAWMGEKTTGLARANCSTKSTFATYCTLGAKRLAQSELMLFVSQLPLAWQSQGRESIAIDVYPCKFRKNRNSVHKDVIESVEYRIRA